MKSERLCRAFICRSWFRRIRCTASWRTRKPIAIGAAQYTVSRGEISYMYQGAKVRVPTVWISIIVPIPTSIRTPFTSLLMREISSPVGLARKYSRSWPSRWARRRFLRSNSTRRPGMKKSSRETDRVSTIATAKPRMSQTLVKNARPDWSATSRSIASWR